MRVSSAGVPVPDRCREELHEPPGSAFARAGDDHGQRPKPRPAELASRNWYEVAAHGFGRSFLRTPNSLGSRRSAGSVPFATVLGSTCTVFGSAFGVRKKAPLSDLLYAFCDSLPLP